jgi:hypothetical protein
MPRSASVVAYVFQNVQPKHCHIRKWKNNARL